MSKSVYSIVLSDDVVAQIDRLAYSNGTSRSNMINQILAERVSYITPEKRLSNIFAKAVELVGCTDELQVMLRPSDTMLFLKSALSYKYNPTVKYSVELYKQDEALGELRVTLRTQSASLICYIDAFFELWNKTEEKMLENAPECSIGGGRYSRKLTCRHQAGGEEIGQAIINYVETMDKSMKLFFSDMSRGYESAEKIARIYSQYKKENLLLL
ncbi:MAG: CopG family transcriptional regulator [Clostridiaceae bacterium]|nr:CopG family transcriptional regulator [Clostridiaceae bacterium]